MFTITIMEWMHIIQLYSMKLVHKKEPERCMPGNQLVYNYTNKLIIKINEQIARYISFWYYEDKRGSPNSVC